MRKKAKVTHLTREYEKGKPIVVGIKVETEDDRFVVPVVDVRTNDDNRRRVNQIQKDSNASRGSRFMKTTYSQIGKSYQVSQKK